LWGVLVVRWVKSGGLWVLVEEVYQRVCDCGC
jgi:hypothetical protein